MAFVSRVRIDGGIAFSDSVARVPAWSLDRVVSRHRRDVNAHSREVFSLARARVGSSLVFDLEYGSIARLVKREVREHVLTQFDLAVSDVAHDDRVYCFAPSFFFSPPVASVEPLLFFDLLNRSGIVSVEGSSFLFPGSNHVFVCELLGFENSYRLRQALTFDLLKYAAITTGGFGVVFLQSNPYFSTSINKDLIWLSEGVCELLSFEISFRTVRGLTLRFDHLESCFVAFVLSHFCGKDELASALFSGDYSVVRDRFNTLFGNNFFEKMLECRTGSEAFSHLTRIVIQAKQDVYACKLGEIGKSIQIHHPEFFL